MPKILGEGVAPSLQTAKVIAEQEEDNSELHSYKAEISIPEVTKDLITHLKRVFTIKLSEQHSIRDYDTMLGEQRVIEHLQSLLQEQK